MTYGLGMLLREGLVMAADTRTNAGVDHIATMRKLTLFQQPGTAMMCVASAGNLATTQSVVTRLNQRLGVLGNIHNLFEAPTMFEAATIVGNVLREVMAADASHVSAYGDASASLLLGGQIQGEGQRLFLIYSAGNFIEASEDTPFLQIGELKYGKPILDRTVTYEMHLGEAQKVLLISFDATIRSNLSVALPIDVFAKKADDLNMGEIHRVNQDDVYFNTIRKSYSEGLKDVVSALPIVDWS
ncbi:MAG: peptidase [Pseudomonadota bacterium]